MSTRISRVRLAVTAVAAAGLCLAGTATLATPSQATPGSCDTAFPIADLTANQDVHGLTVTQGTDPSSGAFTGTVIGVLKDGIEPGVDMVMAKLDSNQIKESGIWEGMSGSPVYATDGRLIGAVAYTLTWGATPVAGITPWEDMQAYAGTDPTPLRVPVSRLAAHKIAGATDVTTAQASQGFSELRAPALISGLGARALSMATGRPYLNPNVAPAGRADAVGGPTADDMVAGGNLVATESTGDITFGALGTITSVCAGRVVGFGHPMEFFGPSSYGMAGADTLFVQSDPAGPSFKVANIGSILGTVDQDRMTGISGMLGTNPPSFPISNDLTYTPDSGPAPDPRVGTSNVQLPEAAASVAFYELMANHQRVVDAEKGGTEDQSWTIHGHTAAGDFTLQGGNRYTDTSDLLFASVWDLPDLLWLLSNVDGVTIDSVDSTSQVTDSTTVHKIQGLQQKRGSQWVNVGGTHLAVFRAGKAATLRLRYVGGDTGTPFTIDVPARAAGSGGRLYAEQAPMFWFERSFPHTIEGVQKLVETMPKSDQAAFDMFAFGKRRAIRVHGLTERESEVITGRTSLRFVVR